MLTAVVLTLNEEYHLPDCLTSLAWVDEVVVFEDDDEEEEEEEEAWRSNILRGSSVPT